MHNMQHASCVRRAAAAALTKRLRCDRPLMPLRTEELGVDVEARARGDDGDGDVEPSREMLVKLGSLHGHSIPSALDETRTRACGRSEPVAR